MTLAVPYHLDERLPELDAVAEETLVADLPDGDPWWRMATLYDTVAERIHRSTGTPVVVSGDCTTSLGTLAGLQRAGRDPGIVWFDAHADFHTEHSTTSGYLGGMPLALAVGLGTPPTLPQLLGLRAVPDERVVLVDARDTDPGETELLASRQVRVLAADEVESALPDGEFYLHIDADVCDPSAMPDLLYPTPGGVRPDVLVTLVRRLAATGRVAALGIAATWRQGGEHRAAHEQFVADLVAAVG